MGLSKFIVSFIRQSFEQHCLMLLTEAYNSSIKDKKYSTEWVENDFTEMLDQYIAKNEKRLQWCIYSNTEQHLHNGCQTEKGFANREKRIDMKMSLIKFQKEYHFYVEAKRLREHESALSKRYIETGIDNYIQNIYPKGILVGYLLEGDINNTIQGINNILNKSNRSSEWLYRKPHLIHNEYFESIHAQYGTLQHFVLNYV